MTKANVIMKKTSQQMIEFINNILNTHQQTTRVTQWTGNSIFLSTGRILTGNERYRFIKRVTTTKTELWVKNIDNLLSGKITEKEIKSQLCSLGGVAAQKKHGDTIKLNLSTGKPWNAGTRGQNLGTRGPLSQSIKDKISLKNSGINNGMYNVKMSDSDKQIRSQLMKSKILDGSFTPNSNNRNTHWDATLDGKKYRSSWEALYQYINEFAEYEKLRILYEIDSTNRVYIVDFVDHHNKLVIEIKPRELCSGHKFDSKWTALTTWAKNNRYDVLLVDKKWLQEQSLNIDYTRFDEKTAKKIRTLRETN